MICGMMNINAAEKIKAIIFDCDGTLVDSEPTHHLAYQHVLKKWGAQLPEDEYRHYAGIPAEETVKILAEKKGIDSADEILKDKKAKYYELRKAGHPPIRSTIDFLRRVAAEKDRLGLKIGLASAADKEEILINLRHHQIEHLFDVILSGVDDLTDYNDPEGVNKPKPYIYLHAAKLLNLSPEECVVIEDSRSGITSGVDAGCFVIAVPNQHTEHHDLSHAHLRIENLAELSIDEFLKMTCPKLSFK